MNNNKLSLLALAISFASGSCFALQALEDETMQDITGQGGITIEQTTTNPDGLISSIGELSFTQKGYGDDNDATLRIENLKNYEYKSDENGNFIGLNTNKKIIDIDSEGNLTIKTEDIDTIDNIQGAMFIGKNKFSDGSEVKVWKFKDGSYLATEVLNTPEGAKIISKTVMTAGSGYTQRDYANGIVTENNVYYIPAEKDANGNELAPEDRKFESNLILTSHDNNGKKGLKLEFGTTAGAIEMRDLTLYEYEKDAEGNPDKNTFTPVFKDKNGNAISYYTTGYGNIQSAYTEDDSLGYLTIESATDENGDPATGLQGSINANVKIGSAYIIVKNNKLDANGENEYDRFSLSDVVLATGYRVEGEPGLDNGDIKYRMHLFDNGYSSGLEGVLFADVDADGRRSVLDLTIGTMKFADADGQNSTDSFSSMSLRSIDLMGGEAEFAYVNSNMFGEAGVRQIVNIDRASFSYKIAGNATAIENSFDSSKSGREGWVEANAVIENLSIDQHVGNTKLGIMTVVESNSFDLTFNSIKAGNQEIGNPQGQSGRLVINNYSQAPGSYTRIEPLNY